MGQVKEVIVKKSNMLFFNGMFNFKHFHSNLLTILYSYITIKKIGDCEDIHSVDPLYFIIHSATGHFREKTTTNT